MHKISARTWPCFFRAWFQSRGILLSSLAGELWLPAPWELSSRAHDQAFMITLSSQAFAVDGQSIDFQRDSLKPTHAHCRRPSGLEHSACMTACTCCTSGLPH